MTSQDATNIVPIITVEFGDSNNIQSLEENLINLYEYKNSSKDFVLTEDGYKQYNNSKDGFFNKVKNYATDTFNTYKQIGETALKYNQDIGTGMVRGGAKLIEGVGSLGIATLEKLDLVSDNSVQKFGDYFAKEIYPRIGETETMAGGFAEGLTQYMIPGVGYYKLFNGILQGRKILGPIVRGLMTEGATVATAQVAGDPNLVGFFVDVFGVDKKQADSMAKEFVNWLATPEEDYNADSVFEEKIKSIIADGPIGPVGEFIGPALTLFGNIFKKGKNDPEIMQEFKSLSASDTPEELKDGYPPVANKMDNLTKSEEPFYSNVVNAIQKIDIPEQGIDITQFTNTIKNTPGVKQSELDDMGFDEFFLDDKPALVTKERVKEFLDKKALTNKVKTTVLGEDKVDTALLIRNEDSSVPLELENTKTLEDAKLIIMNDEPLYNQMREYYKKYIDKNNIAFPIAYDDLYGSDLDNLVQKFLNDEFKIGSKSSVTSKTFFGEYTLPGGEDYKELLISSNGTAQVYTKDHFSKAGVVPKGENLLAHVRFNTRTINGKKTLFIEELQSDLHQAGRKEGYRTNPVDVEKAFDNLENYKKELDNKYDISSVDDYEDVATDVEIEKLQDLRDAIDNVKEASGNIPDAPFKKNWHELAMKRIIKYAIDNDFEAISFTPGSVQVERYDLSKQITSMRAEKIKGGTMDGKYELTINVVNDQLDPVDQIDRVLSEDELEEFIGKDLAKKIVDDSPNFPDGKIYSGIDLKVGGEGMIGFYDKILPKFINKFSKKYGTKLETTKISAGLNFSKNAQFNHTNTALKNAKDFDDVYNLIDTNTYLNSEFKLFLRDETNYKLNDLPNLFKDKEKKEALIRRWLFEDYGLDTSQLFNTTNVPFLEITPEMKMDIYEKGVPIAKVKKKKVNQQSTRVA